MANITFADVVHQSIQFSTDDPSDKLVLDLIDSSWVQRLRDISQTANTRLVYMFSEHSRFGHSLGVTYLGKLLLNKLHAQRPAEVAPYRSAVLAAALLHDIGHLAPGSHTAYKAWFPGQPDKHEALTRRIISEDPELAEIFSKVEGVSSDLVNAILEESDSIPAWTWEAISGGGWNVDRGNWCIVDSIMAGVSYGAYNIPALIDSIVITDEGHLALKENRLDAMMHFAVSRHAMYRQVYQHRVLLAADTLYSAVVQRARDLGDTLPFADEVMQEVLRAKGPHDLSLQAVFKMREAWWRYHLTRWSDSSDQILADLARRLINRDLLKTVRLDEDERHNLNSAALTEEARKAVEAAGFNARYYLHLISTSHMHAGDSHQSMQVVLDNGEVRQLGDMDPLFNAMVKESASGQKSWLALPKEAKAKLGRKR